MSRCVILKRLLQTAVTEGGDFNLHFLKCEVSNKKQISNSIKMSKFRVRTYRNLSCKSSLTKCFSGLIL